MILLVPAWRVLETWPRVNQYIENALEHGPDWMHGMMVYEAAVAGLAQLALVCDEDRKPRAVLVLEVKEFPGPKVVANVWAFGGEPGTWAAHGREIEEFLDAWSSAHGCDTLMMQGRPGWQRLLDDDWQFRQVVEASRPVRNPGHGIRHPT